MIREGKSESISESSVLQRKGSYSSFHPTSFAGSPVVGVLRAPSFDDFVLSVVAPERERDGEDAVARLYAF